ncbi:MAG: nucleoside triphosphate pyrophosphohydrolase [Micrococcales bacterium]|nr:nucleoside triphosphate pyrophosphohydrolase [Micrococcales bacterium]
MRLLRAPGGCPWDAAQTHASLVQYLLEEAYETAEAIEDADDAAMCEELGDLLLQVVFHSEIARVEQRFDLDDVAHQIADKLIRRHPHVFAHDGVPQATLDAATPAGAGGDSPSALTPEESHVRWDRIKAAEKSRTSLLEGIPRAQGALARTQKVIGRARRGGLDIELLVAEALSESAAPPSFKKRGASTGGDLMRTILEADRLGVDAEGALRAATRELERRIDAATSAQEHTTKGS